MEFNNMKKSSYKIEDIFLVDFGNGKKYFQYIGNDLTQLNSEIIRAFNKEYKVDEMISLIDIVNDDIDFHAHCILAFVCFWG